VTELSFPRQYARTQRFSLGEPRNIVVSPDGRRVVFCRSSAGDDPVNSLWVLDAVSGVERVVADPHVLLGNDDDADLPAAERARRERAREMASGVVTYATDDTVTVASFALAGRLFVAGLISGMARELAVEGPVFDPRPDPLARRLAYVSGPTLRVAELDGSSRPIAADPDHPTVSWGSAEFVAAEEMGRQRGYWWSPDGRSLVVERADVEQIGTWYIADPAHPEREPSAHRYPAAGTANADVSLHIVGLDGRRTEIEWDRDAFPYVGGVRLRTVSLLFSFE
jgi:dipeptidyl-peptidase-4